MTTINDRVFTAFVFRTIRGALFTVGCSLGLGAWLLCSPAVNVYAQQTDALNDCLSVHDSKKRLACFDEAAPKAVRQIQDLQTAQQISRETQRVNQQQTAADEQKQLLKTTLLELRKLSVSVEVGINRAEYSKRVLDAASIVKLNSPAIDDPKVRDEVTKSMDAFIDANDLWGKMLSSEYISWFFEHYGAAAAKYGVTARAYSDYNGTFQREGMLQVLSPIWSAAKDAELAAERDSNVATS